MTVTFDSSDQALVAGWNWAVTQVLAYVRYGDPVGDWFEASLPGRNGFCMRDTAHQTAGAQVLGLRGVVKNMLRRFAENIAASRDWCSFWEISGDNLPVEVDYRSDQDFWYNLPANFDVLDCCWRQYQWTGDADYVSDPVFLNFYERTVNDYVQHWDADGDGILEQQPQFGRRGIASYEETISDMRIGGDLLAAQVAGYEAYAHIQRVNSHPAIAEKFEQKAADLRAIYRDQWWNAGEATFYSVLCNNGQFSDKINCNVNNVALYFGAVNEIERAQAVIDELVKAFPSTNVEAQSYFPEVVYRYGRAPEAYAMLRVLMDDQLPRREYPEISYSVLGTIVTSLMGVSCDAYQRKVTTLARLTDEATVRLDHLPILDNEIAVTHQGNSASEFRNEQGEPLLWEARFSGACDQLIVDGVAQPATQGISQSGQPESWVTIPAAPGERHSVRVSSA